MNTVLAMAGKTIRPGLRLRYAAISGLLGWLAAQMVCLPINLIIAVRDTEGQARLFVETLGYGLLVWALWTLWLALIGWMVVALPLVMTIRPCLLVRLRGRLLLGSIALAAAVVEIHWKDFRDAGARSILQRYALMLPYFCFVVSFALVTAATYIGLSKRRLDAAG